MPTNKKSAKPSASKGSAASTKHPSAGKPAAATGPKAPVTSSSATKPSGSPATKPTGTGAPAPEKAPGKAPGKDSGKASTSPAKPGGSPAKPGEGAGPGGAKAGVPTGMLVPSKTAVPSKSPVPSKGASPLKSGTSSKAQVSSKTLASSKALGPSNSGVSAPKGASAPTGGAGVGKVASGASGAKTAGKSGEKSASKGPRPDTAARKVAAAQARAEVAWDKATAKAAEVDGGRRKLPKGGPSKADLRRYRDLLLAKRRELLSSSRELAAEALQAGGGEFSVDHMADHGSDNYEQDFNLKLLEGESEQLVEVRDALLKIDGKADLPFGACEACSDEDHQLCETCPWIPPTRLEALPWTRLCTQMKAREEDRAK